MPWVDIYAVPSGIVTSESGIVTDESGNHPKSVTIGRIRRSRSAGLAGHVAPDSAVTFGRNTHWGDYFLFESLLALAGTLEPTQA